MLIQFSVENYLSFRDRTVFSLVASPREDRHPGHTCPGPGDLRLLRVGALYGANAAGKSNLIKAMTFAQQLITKGTRPGETLLACPFRLGVERRERSFFEFDIALGGLRHTYGFTLERGAIAAEWLYQGPGEHEALVFEREGTDPIRLGAPFAAARDFLSFVARGTRPEQLFLTELEERNVGQLQPLTDWFRGLLASEDKLRLLAEQGRTDEPLVDFELDEESDAALRCRDLLPALFCHSAPSDTLPRPIVVIDELDRSLHPLLTRRLLEQYLASCAGGQLIFTTHDAHLLDLSLLRADEIWFAEKDLEHCTRLYSLAEFKADQLAQLGNHLGQGYRNGRFGAIPFFATRRRTHADGR